MSSDYFSYHPVGTGLGKLAQENNDTLAIAMFVSNKQFFVFDPDVACPLPAYMGNTDKEDKKPSQNSN